MAQFLVNGFLAAAVYLVAGLAFYHVFMICRRFDLLLAAAIPLGAYTVFGTQRLLGLPGAMFLGVIVPSLVGGLSQVVIYGPISKRSGSVFPGMLASFGLYVILQNLVSAVFGDRGQSFRVWSVREGINLLGAHITPIQIGILGCAVLCLLGVVAFMRWSRTGRVMRAVASDPDLAMASGINAGRVHFVVTGLACGIAGLAGILKACDVDMSPTMGMQPMLMGIVAVIVGGRSLWGTAFGALFIGVAQHIGVIWLSTAWQDAIALGILIAFLLFMPQGVLGRKVKKATV